MRSRVTKWCNASATRLAPRQTELCFYKQLTSARKTKLSRPPRSFLSVINSRINLPDRVSDMVEAEQSAAPAEEVAAPVVEVPVKDVTEKKTVVDAPVEDKKLEESKALAIVEDPKMPKNSLDRDVALSKVENEKRLSFIKAWEDNEKSKVENKAQKQLADVAAWENNKKAALEAKLKKMEEHLEKKKAEYAEKMKNHVALVHREAEEKRAIVLEKKMLDIYKAGEMSAKYRATNQTPKKSLGCFG